MGRWSHFLRSGSRYFIRTQYWCPFLISSRLSCWPSCPSQIDRENQEAWWKFPLTCSILGRKNHFPWWQFWTFYHRKSSWPRFSPNSHSSCEPECRWSCRLFIIDTRFYMLGNYQSRRPWNSGTVRADPPRTPSAPRISPTDWDKRLTVILHILLRA